MSAAAIILIPYGVIALGVARYFARDNYYYSTSNKDSLRLSLGWGLTAGVFWPIIAVFLFGAGVSDFGKYLGKKNVAQKLGVGIRLLLIGAPPDRENLELDAGEEVEN